MTQAYIVFEGEAEKRRATAVFSSKWRAEEYAERIAKAWRMKLALLNKWYAAHGLDENIVLRFVEDF